MAYNSKPVNGATKFDKPANQTIPSSLILYDSTGVPWYIWVDDDGDLRIDAAEHAEVAGYDWEATGHSVGAQT